MKRISIFLICLCFLISCATTKPSSFPTSVIDTKIPVTLQCPKPPLIDPPIYPKITWISPHNVQSVTCLDENNMKMLIELILLHKMYIQKLEQILEIYKIQEQE